MTIGQQAWMVLKRSLSTLTLPGKDLCVLIGKVQPFSVCSQFIKPENYTEVWTDLMAETNLSLN